VVDSSRLNYSGKCNNLAEPPYDGQGRIVPINTPPARFIPPVGKAKTVWLTFGDGAITQSPAPFGLVWAGLPGREFQETSVVTKVKEREDGKFPGT